MNNFEICVQQYAFTKRCWWQLSSLAQQAHKSNFVFKLNIHKDDPFHKLNKQLIHTFQDLINLKVKVWNYEQFFRRSATRNADLVEATKQWIIYADADMIFHPTFFDVINKVSLKPDKVNVIPRYNTEIADGVRLINSQSYVDRPIKSVAGRLMKVPLRQSSSVGAGYFQLVNVGFLRSEGLNYSMPSDRALNSRRGPSYHSDKYLRSVLGLNRIQIAPIYHINHYRLRDGRSLKECQ